MRAHQRKARRYLRWTTAGPEVKFASSKNFKEINDFVFEKTPNICCALCLLFLVVLDESVVSTERGWTLEVSRETRRPTFTPPTNQRTMPPLRHSSPPLPQPSSYFSPTTRPLPRPTSSPTSSTGGSPSTPHLATPAAPPAPDPFPDESARNLLPFYRPPKARYQSTLPPPQRLELTMPTSRR